MTSPANTIHDFCHLCMSPSPHHHHHPHPHHHNHHNHHNHMHSHQMLPDYSRCLDMHGGNLDYNTVRGNGCSGPGEGYTHSPFPVSPQSMSSCMYSPSPQMPSSLLSSEQYLSPSKENGLFRDSPQCRRRLDFNHNDFIELSKAVPVAVAKRNERERNRVKLINTTFQTLRQHLPVQNRGAKGQAKKLSKVQTLRSAIDYIRTLEDLVEERKGKTQSKDKGNKIKSTLNTLTEETIENGDAEVKLELVDSANEFDSDKDDARKFSVVEHDSSSVGPASSSDSQSYKSDQELLDEMQSSGSDNNLQLQYVTSGRGGGGDDGGGFICRSHPMNSDPAAVADKLFITDGGGRGKCSAGDGDAQQGGTSSPVNFDITEHDGGSLVGEDDEFFNIDLWF